MKKAILISTIILSLIFFMFPHESFAVQAFSDINDHWAKSYINSLSSAGYINGYPDGAFYPDNNMTRAEFINVLLNCMRINPAYIYTYPSVNTGHWADAKINQAIRQGILNPSEYPYGINPDEYINRAEASAIIARALGLQPDYGKIGFNDWDEISKSPYSPYIKVVHDQGIISGYPSGEFKPNSFITRAQACTIFKRFLTKIHTINGSYSPYNPYNPWDNYTPIPVKHISTLTVNGYRYNPNHVDIYIDSEYSSYRLSDAEIIDEYHLRIGNRTYDLTDGRITVLLQGKYYKAERVIYLNSIAALRVSESFKNSSDYWDDLSLSDIYAIYDEDGDKVSISSIEEIEFKVDNKSTKYDLDEIAIDPVNDYIEINGRDYRATRITLVIDRKHYSSDLEYDLEDIRTHGDELILDCEKDSDELDIDRDDDIYFYDDDGDRISYLDVDETEIYAAGNWIDLDDRDIEIVDEDEFEYKGKTYEFENTWLHRTDNDKQYEIYKSSYSSGKLRIYIDEIDDDDYLIDIDKIDFYENSDNLHWNADDVEVEINNHWYDFDELSVISIDFFEYNGHKYDWENTYVRKYYSGSTYRIIDTDWDDNELTINLRK